MVNKGLIWGALVACFLLPVAFATGFIIENKDDASDIYFAVNGTTGRVGIGTADPDEKLHIHGTTVNNALMISHASDPSNYNLRIYQAFSSGNAFRVEQSGNQIIGSRWAGNNLFFLPDGGNVGIGTNNPDAPLTVVGSGSEYMVDSTSYDRLIVATGVGSYAGRGLNFVTNNLEAGIFAGYVNTDLIFGTRHNPGSGNANFERMRITSTGNVGIGTNNPDAKLHIEGGFDQILLDRTGVAQWGIEINSNQDFRIRNIADDGRFTITPTGNVGIGTTTPSYTLDVSGDGRFTEDLVVGGKLVPYRTEDQIAISHGSPGTERWQIRYSNTGSPTWGLQFRSAESENVRFFIGRPGSTLNSYINPDGGNFGIGTTSPSAKLHVADGAILASGTTGGTPVSGPGRRMMWIPDKAAFRAGEVGGAQWNDENIGHGSFAIGYEAVASGLYSIAMGTTTAASEPNSVAIGQYSSASGAASIAIGENVQATANNALALGRNFENSVAESFAVGFGSPSLRVTDSAVIAENELCIGSECRTDWPEEISNFESQSTSFTQPISTSSWWRIGTSTDTRARFSGILIIQASSGTGGRSGSLVAAVSSANHAGGERDKRINILSTTGSPAIDEIRMVYENGQWNQPQHIDLSISATTSSVFVNVQFIPNAGSNELELLDLPVENPSISGFDVDVYDANRESFYSPVISHNLAVGGSIDASGNSHTLGRLDVIAGGSASVTLENTGDDIRHRAGRHITFDTDGSNERARITQAGNFEIFNDLEVDGSTTVHGDFQVTGTEAYITADHRKVKLDGITGSEGDQVWLLLPMERGNHELIGSIYGQRNSGHWEAFTGDILISTRSGSGEELSSRGSLTSTVLREGRTLSLVSCDYEGTTYWAIRWHGGTFMLHDAYFDGYVTGGDSNLFANFETGECDNLETLVSSETTTTYNHHVAVEGSLTGSGDSIFGSGTRMMWLPDEGAFRIGEVSGTQWNGANIGVYSFATGYDVIASGGSSVAMGSETTASELYSVAMGAETTASGTASVAMGMFSVASGYASTAMGSGNASEDFSVAMGELTTANGSRAIATGHESTASGMTSTAMGRSTTASNFYSTAMGAWTIASGQRSTAMGSSTTASGYSSTAMGSSTTASETVSTAMGIGSTASGFASTAIGQNTNASGYSSTAMGSGTTASGDYATTMGYETTASNFYSTAMGAWTIASGAESTAMGYETTASEWTSTAMGYRTTASGEISTAMGSWTTASGEVSTAMGGSTTASGIYSTAMGAWTTASGDYSVAIGENVMATADNAFALGKDFENSVAESFAVGFGQKDFEVRSGEVNVLGHVSVADTLTVDNKIDHAGKITVVHRFSSTQSAGARVKLGEFTVPSNSRQLLFRGFISGGSSNLYGISEFDFQFRRSTGSNSYEFSKRTLNSGGDRIDIEFYQDDSNEDRVMVVAHYVSGNQHFFGTYDIFDRSGADYYEQASQHSPEVISDLSGWTELTPTSGMYRFDSDDVVIVGDLDVEGQVSVTDGGFVVSGTTGSTPVSGTGTRMMWVPDKGAFRAGYALTNGWDDENIGTNSFAVGHSTRATGHISTAAGIGTLASGYASTAMGMYSTASGSYATAMGYQTTAYGQSSLAVGTHTQATGTNSFATGELTTAYGINSIAAGRWVSAYGANSFAIGRGASPASNLVNNIDDSFMVGFGSSTPRLFVNSQRVGIGTTTPTHLLHITAYGYSTQGWLSGSDGRFKTNTQHLNLGLSEVLQLNAVSYDWLNRTLVDGVLQVQNETLNSDVGFIAQDVYELIPQVVYKPENESVAEWAMNYEKLTPILVNAIQEQQELINNQQKQIDELRGLVEQLLDHQE